MNEIKFKERTFEEMMAAKYGFPSISGNNCILDLAVEEYNKMIQEEESLFISAAEERLTKKNRRSKRRKAGFTKSARKNEACFYERSGLLKAESGAIHSRIGSTYNKKKYRRLRPAELNKLINEAIEPIYSYRDYSDDYYDDYMDYLDSIYGDFFDYDDITDIEVKIENSRKEGYSAGYAEGYAAAVRDLQTACNNLIK